MTRTTAINRIAIGDTIRRGARRHPERIALADAQRRMSYAELDRRCNQFAHYLLARGLKRGDAVATLCLNSIELVVVAYGIAKAGGVWVPVNALLQGEALRYILDHVDARLVVVDDELLAPVRADVTAICPQLLVIPCAGRDTGADPLFADALSGQPETEPDVEIEGTDIAQIMYTSGTTARQKGVAISHQAVFISSLSNIIESDMRRDDVAVAVMPIFHCAQHSLVSAFLHLGATLWIERRFDPEALMRTIQAERVSWIFLLPMMYRALLAHPGRAGYDLSSLRLCLYAMTPMDPATLARLTKEICPNFALGSGQTETYPGSTSFKPEHQLAKVGNYWGTPVLIDDMAIMDDEGRLLPAGQVGELVVRGPNVMAGYYKDEAATAEASKFGWHHTGDLCYIDEDGLIAFVDRKKDMIKTGGENVASIAVETVLLGHPGVANAVVVGLPHPHWIEAVTAFVVRQPGAAVDEAALLDLCRQRLGKHEVPKAVVFLDKLPATATGKVQKHVLRSGHQALYAQAGG